MTSQIKKDILDQLQIEEPVYDEILQEFGRDVLHKIPEMKAVFLQKDILAAKKILHSLKGTAENLRVRKMIIVIDALRVLAGQDNIDEAVEMNLKLLDECAADIFNAL